MNTLNSGDEGVRSDRFLAVRSPDQQYPPDQEYLKVTLEPKE
jgi:hypothetical protein